MAKKRRASPPEYGIGSGLVQSAKGPRGRKFPTHAYVQYSSLILNKIVTEDGLKPVSFISFFRIDLTELDSFFFQIVLDFFLS